MKLFQSIFGIGDSRGRYPASLIDEAIERAVAATDARLRVLPGYRKALSEPAIHAIDQVIALEDAIPAHVPAGNREFQDEAGAERTDLARQRDLLRRKLTALEHGGWTFEVLEDESADMADSLRELDTVEEQLAALGPNTKVLHAHRDILAEVLGEAEHHLWAEEITLCLDAMNIQREAQLPSVRRIVLQELRNSRGQRAVMLPLAFAPADLPPREDLVAAAARYLY